MGVIYRPNRGTLDEAMTVSREFCDFVALQNYIVEKMKPWIKLNPQEVIPAGDPVYDERIGWKDLDLLCIDRYDNIEDKEGYIHYFNGKYDHPLCIGIFATEWEK